MQIIFESMCTLTSSSQKKSGWQTHGNYRHLNVLTTPDKYTHEVYT